MNGIWEYVLLGLGIGATYVLAAQGLVVIFRGSGVVNFAAGAMSLVGTFAYVELGDRGFAVIPALVLAVGAAALIGMLTHLLVMRRLAGASQLARVIATLGLLAFSMGLLSLRYEDTIAFPTPIVANHELRIFGAPIGSYSLVLVGISIGLTAVLWAVYRYTRFGIQTRAVAENRRAAAALGHSPDRIAALNWAIGGGLAGLAGILIAPITSASLGTVGLLLVPALSAALLGDFSSFGLTLLGGMIVGIGESELQKLNFGPGWSDAAPFLLIVVVLLVRGSSLPPRSYVHVRLPRVGTGRIAWVALACGLAVAIAVILLASAPIAAAITTSITIGIVLLSWVVVTGYAGQLSLAQLGMAGVGAFIAARLAQSLGLSFWEAVPIGVLGTLPIGALIGLPAVRARGMNLAIVTLSMGLIVEEVLLGNTNYTGGNAGTTVRPPSLFGLDLNAELHPQRYAILCLVAFALAGLAVCNLRRGSIGRRLLAVRSNERAAATLGISVAAMKVYAFSVASALAALGGVLLVYQVQNITFNGFDVATGITLLSIMVISGIGFVGGSVFAAIGVPGGLVAYFFSSSTTFINILAIAGGLGTMVGLAKFPDGIAGQMAIDARRIRGALGARLARRGSELPLPAADAGLERRLPGADAGSAPPAAPDRGPAGASPPRSGHELAVDSLTVRFGGVVALDGVSLSVRSGEIVAVIGPNGAGKTTLIDTVTGLARPAAGTITLDGARIETWSPARRARAGLARSFQSLELFDDLTVEENVRVAAERPTPWSYATDLLRPRNPPLPDAALGAIEEFQLAGDLRRMPEQLAFGRRRMVGIVRAVAGDPGVLLLDEPAAGLDERESRELASLLRMLADTWGLAVLLVEHDMSLVMGVSDRVVAIDFGRVIATGSPAEVRADQAVIDAYLGEATGDETTVAPVPGGAVR